MAADVRAFRASLLHFRGDPHGSSDAHEYIDDGVLVVEKGRVTRAGPASELLPSLPSAMEVVDRRGMLIIPGFVDTHIHYAQTDVIASPARNVLHWLETHIFP